VCACVQRIFPGTYTPFRWIRAEPLVPHRLGPRPVGPHGIVLAMAARIFLVILVVVFAFVYALPILFVPKAWARAFRWDVTHADEPLSLYFARCLGAVAIAILALIARAAIDPSAHREVFDLIIGVAALLTGVHVVGAIQKKQPWTETAEIALYASTAIAAVILRPS
jgi:hypothetical protein